jgi:hypothetical protein
MHAKLTSYICAYMDYSICMYVCTYVCMFILCLYARMYIHHTCGDSAIDYLYVAVRIMIAVPYIVSGMKIYSSVQ